MTDKLPPSAGSRRWPNKTLAALGTLVLVALGVWYWQRAAGVVPPPEVSDTEDVMIIQAIEKGREEVLRQPRSALAWGKLGMVFQANGCYPEALTCYRQAEQLDERDFRWPYLQAMLQHEETASALEKLRRAQDLASQQIFVRLTLAEELLNLGHLGEAAEHFQAILQQEPRHPHAILGLARVAALEAKWQECLQLALRLRFTPQVMKTAHLLLAQVWQRLGDPKEAQAALEQAGRLPPDPDRPDPVLQEVNRQNASLRGRLTTTDELIAKGEVQAAIPVLQEAVEIYPKNYLVHLALGKALVLRTLWRDHAGKKADYEAATQALLQAEQLAPNNAQVQFYLGMVFVEQEKILPDALPRAAAYLQKAIALSPAESQSHFYLGKCLSKQGKVKEAMQAFHQVLLLRPDDANAHQQLGELFWQTNHALQAWFHLCQAQQLQPADSKESGLLLLCQWRLQYWL